MLNRILTHGGATMKEIEKARKAIAEKVTIKTVNRTFGYEFDEMKGAILESLDLFSKELKAQESASVDVKELVNVIMFGELNKNSTSVESILSRAEMLISSFVKTYHAKECAKCKGRVNHE